MANEYFAVSGSPATSSQGASATIRSEFTAIAAGFDKLPTLSGNGSKLVQINSGGTAMAAIALTVGAILFGGAAGVLGQDANLTYTTGTSTLAAPKITASTSLASPILDSVSGSLVLKGAGTTALTLTGANAVFAGTISSGQITANLTGNVSGSAATVTGAAQAAITSVGTLSSLTMGGTLTMGANTLALATATVSGTPAWSSTQAMSISGSSASATGNAGTATALQTARTINGVSFDGTGNITVAAAAGTLTGNTLAAGVTASSLTSVGTLAAITTSGALSITAAASKIIPGATSLSLRNNADNADNILIADNGNTTVRGTLTATGGFVGISGITIGTEQASTSGTSIDFTGIPAGTKRICIMLSGVSTSGTSNLLVQIGDSGGVEVTGYVSEASNTAASANSTIGYILTPNNGASQTRTGTVVLDLEHVANHTWIAHGCLASDGITNEFFAGSKSTSAELDRVRITTVNGTDTFDLGAINISYQS
jgi:hypothetical protein